MIKYIVASNPTLFDIFQKDIWDKEKNLQNIEIDLQNIVDVFASTMGFPLNICHVKIADLNSSAKKGEFDYSNNELRLEKALVVDKLKSPYYENGLGINNIVSNRETLEVLFHEFRHAVQNYFRHHPDQCPNKEYLELITLNVEKSQNSKLLAYFADRGNASSLIYSLQPVERDAFLFAEEQCQQLVQYMHERFPQDLSFCISTGFSNFRENVEFAKEFFNTENPYQDIDDIVRYINHKPTLKELNKEMLKVVKETQAKSLKQQIVERFTQERKINDGQKATTLNNNSIDIEWDEFER